MYTDGVGTDIFPADVWSVGNWRTNYVEGTDKIQRGFEQQSLALDVGTLTTETVRRLVEKYKAHACCKVRSYE